MTKRMESARRFGMIFLAVVMLAGNMLACTLPGSNDGPSTLQPIPIEDDNALVPEQGEFVINGDGNKPGLSIRLSDGQDIPSVIERLVPVLGESLTQEEIDDILARLTPWVEDQGLEVDFRFPEAVLPPPLTGDTRNVT